MPKGSITEVDREFIEEWENVSEATFYVLRYDVRGEARQEGIPGGRKFKLTTEERIITEDRVLRVERNPFRNGSFRPITVPDEYEPERNPNALSNDQIQKMFGASELAFTEFLDGIDSPATMRRAMALGEDSETLTTKRAKLIRERFQELNGPPRHARQKDEDRYRGIPAG
jgi:hypothetical protein